MSDAEAENRISRWDALLGIGAEREAVARAVAEERAAVVAWLREHWSEVLEQTPQQTARLIERGAHRREEKT